MPMTEFCEQDLTGARFEQVSLTVRRERQAMVRHVMESLTDERDLTSLEKES
jgi:hypothetical protein